MNQLSWMLYWASVAPSLSTFVKIVGFITAMASLLGLFFYYIGAEDTRSTKWDSASKDYLREYTDTARICQKLWVFKILLPVSLLPWGLSFAVPDKDTFYMIAASEAGAKALETPEFGKLRLVINKYLDGQLKPEAPVGK